MRKDTLEQAIEGFFIVRAVELSPNIADLYKWALNKLCDHLDNPEVGAISYKELQEFINYLNSKHYTPVRKNHNTEPWLKEDVTSIMI